MESKQLLQTLSTMAQKIEKIQGEIEHLRLELARSERVRNLEIKMAGMETKVWVLFGTLILIAGAFIGYYFNTHG